MRWIALIVVMVVAACDPVAPPLIEPAPRAPIATEQREYVNLLSVIDRMDPVIERECRNRTRGVNCDFMFVVDDRSGRAPNAFQTLDRETGRPVVGFTESLLEEVRNADELALILGHEAAHHIEQHLARRQRSAMAGAAVMGELVSLGGADAASVRRAREMGADIGARAYSQEFELEADALGARLAFMAGYDPIRGTGFLQRMPEGHHHFLATHPPAAQRIALIGRVTAQMGGS